MGQLKSLLAAALLCLLCAAWPAGAAAPDFATVVALEPEVIAPGKVAGLIRNVGDWTVRNVVLRVRHRWAWAAGGRYDYSDNSDNTVVTRLVYPGDPAGFASVHIPPPEIPANARYSMDVTVLELTEIRRDAE